VNSAAINMGVQVPLKTCCNYSRSEEEVGIKENDEGVNLTLIYCKNFYKCHNVPPAQQ
jgi:hypothetical protein